MISMITGLINEDLSKKKPFDVERQKFEEEPEYKDVKRADQSADNDIDRVTPGNDPGKKATDEAYIKNQSGSGTGPSSGRQ